MDVDVERTTKLYKARALRNILDRPSSRGQLEKIPFGCTDLLQGGSECGSPVSSRPRTSPQLSLSKKVEEERRITSQAVKTLTLVRDPSQTLRQLALARATVSSGHGRKAKIGCKCGSQTCITCWMARREAINEEPSKPPRTGNVTIRSLRASDSKLIRQVAEWECKAFGGRSVEEREQQFLKTFRKIEAGRRDNSAWGMIETFVALDDDDGTALGSVSLVSNDMAWWKEELQRGLEDARPWLSSLFVSFDARQLGIGGKLVDHVTAEAAKRGYAKLFLYFLPEDKKLNAWYEKKGFSTWGWKGSFHIMQRVLPQP